MIDITDPIQNLWPNCPVPLLQGIIDTADDVFAKFNIADKPLVVMHGLVQFSAETDGGSPGEIVENMNYSADGLMRVFGVGHHSAAITPEEAAQLAHHPEQIAERVYGLGNPHKAQELGNLQPGDGWKHRGMGLLNTTGARAQARLGEIVGLDLLNDPDAMIRPETALLCGFADFIAICGCQPYAEADDLLSVSGLVNVGHIVPAEKVIGWQHRVDWYQRWRPYFQ